VGPHCERFLIKLESTGESGLPAIRPGVRAPRNRGENAGRRQGLEAGTDPQTIFAGGKGSFVVDWALLALYHLISLSLSTPPLSFLD
jgi:hypothetical protein